jgi:hypothetical protein
VEDQVRMESGAGSILEDFASALVEPWYEALANPGQAQVDALKELLKGYAKTTYGSEYGAKDVGSLFDFQRAFPIAKYQDLKPYLERVKQGSYSALLPEPAVRWVMTRGTTGTSKMIPATQTHLAQVLTLGARGIVNFALKRKDFAVLTGRVLNLNFPSEVAVLCTDKGEEPYGYSSGTYAKLNPALGEARLVPRQEEIDSLGCGIRKDDWEARFELVYHKAKGEDVKSVMGVAPIMTEFARYVHKKHGVYPKEVWKMKGLFPTSVAKIQTNYAPQMKKMYGDVPVVELYTATEGVFAQQLDDHPYVCPNYDSYFFEVKTRGGLKMLHEMERGEWGRVIVSTPNLPRYDIGDLIEAEGKGYFRVIGRANLRVASEHVLFNLMTLRKP